jgi:hypothetical protein
MQIPVPPAGSGQRDLLAEPAFTEPADRPLPEPALTVVPGGGDTTDVRATLHAVPRPE